MEKIYNDITIITNSKFIVRDYIESEFYDDDDDYEISFCKLIENKLYISYKYVYTESYYCLFIVLDINKYIILENKLFKDCTFSDFIDGDLYLMIDNYLCKYDKQNGLCDIDCYQCYKQFMFKHNDEIYFLSNYNTVSKLYNINKDIVVNVPLNISYSNLNIFYSNGYIFMFNVKYNNNFNKYYVYDINENKIINNFLNIPEYSYSIKMSENICLFILEDGEHLIFDFNFEITSVNIHLNDVNLLYNINKIYNCYNYYYINENYYLYDNKLYIVSYGTISNLSKEKLITLKSLISNKQESIPKDILISRCELFKGIFELYDEKDSNNELINEKFEYIDIYFEYITTGKIKYTEGNIKDILNLFDICLYFGDIDIEYIINYIIKYVYTNYENIHIILNKLNDFPKYKNILLNKYFKNISEEEYIKFISKCDYDLLKFITIYNKHKIISN